MLTSEEADLIRPGEAHPSNMGIRLVANSPSPLPSQDSNAARESSSPQVMGMQAATGSDEESTPPSQMRRLNVEGDAVPGSQDSTLAFRAHQQLHISQPIPDVATATSRRRTRQRMTAAPSTILRCAQCGPGPGAFQAADSRGLLPHLCGSHLGQPLQWRSYGVSTRWPVAFVGESGLAQLLHATNVVSLHQRGQYG